MQSQITPDGARLYVSDGYSGSSVSVIDTSTDVVIATIQVGAFPFGVAVSPDGTKVYVANLGDGTVSVIDIATNVVTATVQVEYPFGVAVTPDGTKVYVTSAASGIVSVIDTATDTVIDTFDLGTLSLNFGKFIGPATIGDTTPPTVTVSATPNTLWPPNHKMVDVTIDGSATDDMSGIASVVITVTDEYGLYNMTVSGFGSTIQLEAWREGTDKDGRIYTITAVATDKAGNQSTTSTQVIVPHDMRDKK
jgi:YVTN family beta-propeller protein